MKIQEAVMFAFPTRGQALEIANSATEDLAVVAITIFGAKESVAWMAVPVTWVVNPPPKVVYRAA